MSELPDLGAVSVSRIRARSVLTRSKLGERKFGFRYSMNPYRGCPHACVYCYASSVTRDARPWGRVLDVKENAPEALAEDLRHAPRGLTLVSSATDPYPPQEAEERVTRRCLELLRSQNFPVSVLTRSPLVLRDVDLFEGWENVDVGFSFTSIRNDPTLEPRVPPVARRLDALRALASQNIPTWASLAPILPGSSERELVELLQAAGASGVRNAFIDPLLLDAYPDAAGRMKATGRPLSFAPGEAERLLGALEREAPRAGVEVHRRFLAWRTRTPSAQGGPERSRALVPT